MILKGDMLYIPHPPFLNIYAHIYNCHGPRAVLSPCVSGDVNLGWFDNIVPCGIEGKEVTSLTKEAGRTVTIDDVLPIVEAALQDVFE